MLCSQHQWTCQTRLVSGPLRAVDRDKSKAQIDRIQPPFPIISPSAKRTHTAHPSFTWRSTNRPCTPFSLPPCHHASATLLVEKRISLLHPKLGVKPSFRGQSGFNSTTTKSSMPLAVCTTAGPCTCSMQHLPLTHHYRYKSGPVPVITVGRPPKNWGGEDNNYMPVT